MTDTWYDRAMFEAPSIQVKVDAPEFVNLTCNADAHVAHIANAVLDAVLAESEFRKQSFHEYGEFEDGYWIDKYSMDKIRKAIPCQK